MVRKINSNLAELFDQKQQNLFCDVTLIATADGSGIRAHRNVLHTASAYFKTLLTADMKERSLEEIPLAGVSGVVLSQLIDYAYTQHIDIDASNVLNILAAADLFLLDGVVKMCEQVYKQSINATNACQILAIAAKYKLNELQVAAQNFAHDNFVAIVSEPSFLELELEFLAGYLSSDEIRVDSEEDVFNAIAKWIEADPEDRKQHYAAMMKTVRMSRIQCKFLCGRIRNWSRQMNLDRVFVDVCALKYQQDVEVTDADRAPHVKHMFTVGQLRNGGGLQIERYSIATNEWMAIRQIAEIEACQVHCIVDCLYLFEAAGEKVLRLPLSTMELEIRKPRNIGHKYFASIAVGQYVYCIGGCRGRAVRMVERYDTQNDEWTDIGMLNQGRYSAGVAILLGKIYVVGGYAGGVYLRSVERYDLETNQWTNLAELNVARGFLRCGTIKGSIYAVGGFSQQDGRLDSIEKYDVQLDQWNILQIEHRLDVPRSSFGMAVIGEWIYIAGGRQQGELHTNAVKKINVCDGRIEELSSLNHKLLMTFSVLSRQ